jgi:hypothetical protein
MDFKIFPLENTGKRTVLLLDLRRLALSSRLLVVWFRINPILLALFQNLIMLLLQFSL